MIYFSDFTAPIGSGAIDYKSVESLAAQNVATATPTTIATLSLPASEQEASASYVVFWMTEATVASSGVTNAALYEGAGAVQSGILAAKETVSPVDKMGYGCAYIFTAAATPADVTFTIKGSQSASASTNFTNSRIVILRLGADDKFITAVPRQTTTSTTFVAAATLNFTPPTAGDYLIVSGHILDNSTGAETCFQLTDGTTSTDNQGIRCGNSDRRWPNLAMLKLTGISGAKSVVLNYRAVGGTAGIGEAYLLAIRLGRFANNYLTTLGVDNTGTGTSYTTGLSQTFTPNAANHLTIVGGLLGGSSAADTSYMQYDDGGTVVHEQIREPLAVTDGTREMPYSAARIASYAASSRTQAIQRKTETTNTTTLSRDAVIATLDLTGLVAG